MPTMELALVCLDTTLTLLKLSNVSLAVLFTALSASQQTQLSAQLVSLELIMTMLVSHAPVEMATSSMEPLVNNVPTNVKTVAHPQPPALLVLIPRTEISAKTVPASLDSLKLVLSTALPALKPASPAPITQPVQPAMLPFIDNLMVLSVTVWMDIMNSTTPTKQELARNVTQNARLALLHQLSALPATLAKEEWLELTPMDNRLASANQDSTQLLMVHAFNLTAMLILSVLNANRVLSYV